MAAFRTCTVFVVSILILFAGAAATDSAATPSVEATAVPFGGTVVTDNEASPAFPLLAEATSANGSNTAWAQAAPGRLRATSARTASIMRRWEPEWSIWPSFFPEPRTVPASRAVSATTTMTMTIRMPMTSPACLTLDEAEPGRKAGPRKDPT